MSTTPPKIVIVSLFRNATLHIERYLDQISAFIKHQNWQPWQVHLMLGYGDSIDGTGTMLHEECQFRFNATLLEVNHGGPEFGSIEDARRFRQLAYVYNQVWRRARQLEAPIVTIIESDLIWAPQALATLYIQSLLTSQVLVPMVMHQQPPNWFYDTWAFRKNGVRFTNQPPYHNVLKEPREPGTLIRLDSAGSFMVMPGLVAARVEYTPEKVIVGLCEQIYEKTSSLVLLNPEITVWHP